MKKKIYVSPRICVVYAEACNILAGSGEHKVPSKQQSFSLENDELTSGDGDDVWE